AASAYTQQSTRLGLDHPKSRWTAVTEGNGPTTDSCAHPHRTLTVTPIKTTRGGKINKQKLNRGTITLLGCSGAGWLSGHRDLSGKLCVCAVISAETEK
ncbi:hypothetical protein IRJ41_025516, partial [Triplophysa rosa]